MGQGSGGATGARFLRDDEDGPGGAKRAYAPASEAEDDYAGDATTTGVVVLDGSTTGTLETHDDQDWFAIELAAGQRLEVTLTVQEGAVILVSALGFAGPDGSHAYTEDTDTFFDEAGREVRVRSLIAAEDGVHFVTVSYSDVAPYGYGFAARLVKDDYAYVGDGYDGPPPGTLTVGGQASGTTDYVGDWDSFIVDLESTQAYEVIVRDASGGEGILNVDVTAPDNTGRLGASGGVGEARLSIGPQGTGAYAINVSSAYGALPDGYTVEVVPITDDYGLTPETRGALELGVPTFGRFEYFGDRDEFAFDGVAGQTVRFQLFDGLGAPSDDIFNDPPVVFGPDGEVVEWVLSSDYVAVGYARLTQTGTYTVSLAGSPEPTATGRPHGEYALVAELRQEYALPPSLLEFFTTEAYVFSPPPDLPARDPEAGQMPSLDLNDWPDPSTGLVGERAFFVAEGETLEGFGPMLYGASNAYFQNDGTVWAINDGPVGYGNNWERFVNNGDIISVTAREGVVWKSGGSGLLENHGTITLVTLGSGDAVSIFNPSARDGDTYEPIGWTSVNTGTIRVWAATGSATGFSTFSDQREATSRDAPTLDNSGDIIVQGLYAAYAVSMTEGGGLTNTGRVVAISDFDGTSYGVVSGANFGGLHVVNDGLISADVSVYGATFGGGLALAEIINTGLVEGDVLLEEMQAAITNDGEMDADLYLGAGADRYEGAGGVLYGVAFLGGGEDHAAGGARTDVFLGEDGDDLLIGGGGADFIDGGAGADVIYGDIYGDGGPS